MWSELQLSLVCFCHYPLLESDDESIEEKDGRKYFKLLTKDGSLLAEDPTMALRIAAERMSELS